MNGDEVDEASQANSAAAPRMEERRRYVVALIGNPNTGKTTLFNALTGLSRRTGNYPGVTVDTSLGEFTRGGDRFLVVDLPGLYSLAPRAPDEMMALEAVLGWGDGVLAPDVLLCVIDASNLERNLYLLTQAVEVGVPVVVALTMSDVAAHQGVEINTAELEGHLGIPVVSVHAKRRIGIGLLRSAVAAAARDRQVPVRCVRFPEVFEREVEVLDRRLPCQGDRAHLPRFLIERLLADAGGLVERELVGEWGEDVGRVVAEARGRLASAGVRVPQVEVENRYAWISGVMGRVVRRQGSGGHSWTERIDRVVTHKVWGLLIFLLAMAVTFQTIFAWATPLMDAVAAAVALVSGAVRGVLPDGPLQSLITDGVIGGVGAVLVFVPQIAILFGLITLLEDSGYMARAAFLMDRILAAFGLSGRSFIPLLSSFACAVPGIMSARTIENRRDRIATILVAPLMSCSARLPIYVLFISAFIPPYRIGGFIGLQGLTLFALYATGLLIAPPVALLLKRTLLRGEAVPFLMELPPYKMPAWRVVVFRMYDRSWAFVRRAGTIILATTVLVWALSYYPSQARVAEKYAPLRATATAAQLPLLTQQEAGERLRESFLGRAGRAIEPVVRPLGWDWKIGVATIASLPAREVVIAALGTIYSLGTGVDEKSGELRAAMKRARRPGGGAVYTPAVALSIMVFFALCCQCAATLAAIRRETGRWSYAAFTFIYMTILAYGGAFAVYQVGSRLVGA